MTQQNKPAEPVRLSVKELLACARASLNLLHKKPHVKKLCADFEITMALAIATDDVRAMKEVPVLIGLACAACS